MPEGESGTALLEVRNLKKRFPVVKGKVLTKVAGWVKAVDDVSLSIRPGETFGLVGESGCGKTTISKLILLLEAATSGTVLFRDKNVYEMKRKDLHNYRSSVQAVFQDPTSSLNPRLRVRSIIT